MFGTSRWRPFFARLYLGDHDRFHVRYRLHRARWAEDAHAMAARHGMAVVSETPVPEGLGGALLKLPTWVAVAVDLRGSDEELASAFSTSARHDLQKARTAQFTFTVTRDPSWAGEFHRRYHRPSIVDRHGEMGYVMDEDLAAAAVRDRGGEFVCAWKGGQCIGAILNEPIRDQYALRNIGWRDGDPALRTSGVIAALYWHSMQRARLLGFQRAQLGGTPPCIEDGVFQFKNKWNAALDAAETIWGDHFLLMSPGHPDLRRMLGRRSLIVRNAQRELLVISGKRPGEVTLSAKMAKSIARWYRLCDTPSSEGERANTDLPAPMRAWFRAEDIPQAR
jgi:predicted N-acetyltransferase YhbS